MFIETNCWYIQLSIVHTTHSNTSSSRHSQGQIFAGGEDGELTGAFVTEVRMFVPWRDASLVARQRGVSYCTRSKISLIL